jgi:hypothetical protein
MKFRSNNLNEDLSIKNSVPQERFFMKGLKIYYF